MSEEEVRTSCEDVRFFDRGQVGKKNHGGVGEES